MNKSKIMELSSIYVKPETWEWLMNNTAIQVYKDDTGRCIRITKELVERCENRDETIPEDLAKVIVYADSEWCQWLILDHNGPQFSVLSSDRLPDYSEEWDIYNLR